MSYSANVYNVMIASPSDVFAERNIIREVIYKWNAVNSQTTNIVLLPVGWETHSSPEMGSAPQDIINFQVLANSDILIGVFWTRLGTPTKEHPSGTVEEIEKHIALGKPAMLYFSSRPITPDAIDSEQYDKLKKFKSSCQTRGLYSTFDDISRFKEQFYDHLQQQVNRMQPPITTQNYAEAAPRNFKQISVGEIVLLRSASISPNGEILRTSTLSFGGIIETHELKYIESTDRRKFAKMDSALKDLVHKGLIESVGAKGQVFKVTGQGYEFAERVQESQFNDFIKLIEVNEF